MPGRPSADSFGSCTNLLFYEASAAPALVASTVPSSKFCKMLRCHWFEPPGQRHGIWRYERRPRVSPGPLQIPTTAWSGNDNFPNIVERQAGPLSFSVFGAFSPLPDVAVTGPVVLIRTVIATSSPYFSSATQSRNTDIKSAQKTLKYPRPQLNRLFAQEEVPKTCRKALGHKLPFAVPRVHRSDN